MKTKIIPFDLEMAKKIQTGEIEGRIITSHLGNKVRILCYDFINGTNKDYKLVCAIKRNNAEYTLAYKEDGNTCNTDEGALILEVPDNEPQFKPFDKVLVRDMDKDAWRPRLYSRKGRVGYCVQDNYEYMQILPYEGNEYLVGTTDKPKEGAK